MKKIIKILIFLSVIGSCMYADTTGVTGEAASNANSSDSTTNTSTDNSYTNVDTGKTYKDVSNISAEERTKLKTPLQNLFQTTEWSLFLQEFEINWDIGICGDGLDKALGFRAHMIEPMGYMETSKKPLYFPFANLDLGGSLIKSCPSRASSVEESTRDECMYQHFVYAPIMGMIFKKKLKFVCFNQGTVALPILSEFDPTYLIDVYNYKMIPHIMAMISPEAIISSIINCGSTMAYSMIKGYATNTTGDSQATWDSTSWANNYEDPSSRYSNFASSSTLKQKGLDGLAFIRNTMFYNLGCQGMHPVGGYSEGGDPGVDATLLAYGTTSKLHAASALTQIPILKKQTEFSMEMSSDISDARLPGSTLCKPKTFAMPIETQYVNQRAYPTVGTSKENGESGATSTTMANVPGSKDSFVYVFWTRRDYYAFAYYCEDAYGTEYKLN